MWFYAEKWYQKLPFRDRPIFSRLDAPLHDGIVMRPRRRVRAFAALPLISHFCIEKFFANKYKDIILKFIE